MNRILYKLHEFKDVTRNYSIHTLRSQGSVHELMQFKLEKAVWRESLKTIVHGMRDDASQTFVGSTNSLLEISRCFDCGVSFLKWSGG